MSFLKTRNKHKSEYIIYVENFALREICNATKYNLVKLNQLIYAAAKFLQSKCGINNKKKKCRLPSNKPKSEFKIKKNIKTMRAEISIFVELHKNNELRSGKVHKEKNVNCTVKNKYPNRKKN